MSEKIAGAPTDERAEIEAQAAEKARLRAEEEQQAAKARIAKQEAQALRREEERARQEREAAKQPAPAETPKVDLPSSPATAANSRAAMEEVVALREQAEKERDRLQSLGNEYDQRLRRERERDRIAALRGMGALASLTDGQLLSITPDVDPHAPGGKAQLDEWRENNSGLFLVVEGPTIPTSSEILEHMPVKRSASGLYDEKFLAQMLRDNLGGGN